ncbi:MAG: hypothetical protein IKD70_02045, partial [Eggerthellaceae bacterium]|nr:hypothetical protein [Eggerthellaceae bacterium]
MESSEVSRRDMLKVIGGAAAGALGAGALAGMSGCSKTEVIGVEYISGESESLWLYNPSGV